MYADDSSEQKLAMFRVTRLGEFSPIGWLFTLGSFLKMTKVAQIYGLHFPNVSATCVLILRKNGLGYLLGAFFANSSGHPGYVPARAGLCVHLRSQLANPVCVKRIKSILIELNTSLLQKENFSFVVPYIDIAEFKRRIYPSAIKIKF
jgi:hypothetical protein